MGGSGSGRERERPASHKDARDQTASTKMKLYYLCLVCCPKLITVLGATQVLIQEGSSRRINDRLVTSIHNYTNIVAKGKIKEVKEILARCSCNRVKSLIRQ